MTHQPNIFGDAELTIRGQILSGYAKNFGKSVDEQVDAIYREIFWPPVLWAVREILEKLEKNEH